jgi:hypothetical protein
MTQDEWKAILENPINICPKCNANMDNGVTTYRDGGTRACNNCNHVWHRCHIHKDNIHIPGQYVHHECSCKNITEEKEITDGHNIRSN